MRLRISVTAERSVTVVRICGQLEGEGVLELLKMIGSIEGKYAIDLADLEHADARGVEAIHNIREKGVSLRGLPPLVEMLLNRGGRENSGSRTK
jgi:ABC-type transporter Mla MlaB component